MSNLICFSHLRWDFVWQRPQQLLSRLSERYRVFFVEEPVTNTECFGQHLHVFPGRGARDVTVVRFVQPAKEAYWIGHGDPQTQAGYERLLRGYLEQEGVSEATLWFYTPMALPFLRVLPHDLIVYDVMDELSAFEEAPAGLVQKGEELLKKADVVFAGGVSLYAAREGKNPRLHLFPSGVDAAHYARKPPEPEDLKGLDGPRLGYLGVIDERMDLELLAYLARKRPDWQLVMVGPVIKIAPETLPQAPNLHYLGMKPYEALPGYLAHFEVALIPFAVGEATRFLSPTKTLEYMAAHKPVVSTPIPDVVDLYGEVVRVGASPEAFVAEVEAALRETPEAIRSRLRAEAEFLQRYSWDRIASEMGEVLQGLSKAQVPRG